VCEKETETEVVGSKIGPPEILSALVHKPTVSYGVTIGCPILSHTTQAKAWTAEQLTQQPQQITWATLRWVGFNAAQTAIKLRFAFYSLNIRSV